jgi:hypothetical protein
MLELEPKSNHRGRWPADSARHHVHSTVRNPRLVWAERVGKDVVAHGHHGTASLPGYERNDTVPGARHRGSLNR